MKLLRIETVAELRRLAAAWDDLWWRSDSYLPTHRAELLAQWLEHFAPGRPFVAFVVELDGQFVAAMPLVGERKAGLIPVGVLASNCWSESGTLLLDRSATPAAMEALASAVKTLRWPLISLDAIDTASPGWSDFLAAFAQGEAPIASTPQYCVGLIDITDDWDRYVAALSGNHRSAVKRSLRKAERTGEIGLQWQDEFAAHEVEPLLRQSFEIEDKSWKGAAGSSILRTPGMFEFFLRQAQQLAEWGQVELWRLTLDGRPIAFEYCYVAKSVASSHKIGYDPEFQQFGPGKLLRYLQLQRCFADPRRKLFDTLGIMCESKAKWCTRSYQASRVMAPTNALTAKALHSAYTSLWPCVRRALRGSESLAPPKLGASAAAALGDSTALRDSLLDESLCG